MDPKVCGKLLTLHRRGYGVDVEALCDRFPLREAPEKAPRWDLTGTEGCGDGNRVSWCSWMFSGYMDIYRRKKSIRGATRGPRGWGRAQGGQAGLPTSWPPRWFLDVHSKSSGSRLFQKSLSRRFHSVWTPFDIPFVRNTEIGKKQQFGLGLRLIR